MQSLKLAPNGRIVIPASFRRAMGLKPGDSLIAVLDGSQLILRPRDTVEAELWQLFSGLDRSLADELIQDRKLEDG